MKTIIMKTLATGIVASMLLFTSCEGPAGATGPQGIIGLTGTNGTNGTNGSANVSVVDFTVQQASWLSNTSNWYSDLTVNSLTQQVQDSGAVQVFVNWNTSGSPIWTALPYTFNSSPVYIMNFNTQAGFIALQWVYNTNGGSIGSDPCTEFGVTALQFKVVTIPPAAWRAHPNVNLHNLTMQPYLQLLI